MTPPLCLGCYKMPVKRAYGNYPPSKEFGVRMVDGLRWKCFCSHACQGIYRGEQARDSGQTLAASLERRRRQEQKLVGRLVAACKPLMDDCGKVDAKALVGVLYQEIKRERNLAACARYRERRPA